VACLIDDSKISLLDAATLSLVKEIPLPPQARKGVDFVFSGDGRILVVVTAWDHVQVIDTLDWKTTAEWQSEGASLVSVQASPNGDFLASCGDQLRIWKLANGELICSVQAHRQPTDRVAFSPDGRLLATASQDGSAKIWETASWRELAELRGHLLGVHCLAFSPNSQRLATGSADLEAVKLWDLRTYREVFNLAVPGTSIVTLGFSPGGNVLCAFGQDEQKSQNYLWPVPSLGEIVPLEHPSGKN
jgi:WD40 repeat protein